jgi:hypothetical protein
MTYLMNSRLRTFVLIIYLIVLPTPRAMTSRGFFDVYWTKFDEYSNISWKEERRRLGYFIIQLRNQPGAQAYLVVYAGRRSCEGEARLRAERVKSYVVSSGALPSNRITIIDAGYRKHWSIALEIGQVDGPVLTKKIVQDAEWSIPKSQAKMLQRCENALYPKR